MDYTTLGRTGLQVSVLGLGGGGYSRLGLGLGGDDGQAEGIVRLALDLGVNFIDTAESYGTQRAIGKALAGVKRDDVVLSTKKGAGNVGEFRTPEEMRLGVEQCLRELRTDYVDVFHVHGVMPEEYGYVVAQIVPVLQKMRDEGKIRFIGITEMFGADTSHKMLSRAIADGCWDVIMVGLNMLNPSASRDVLPQAQQAGIGTLVMFAVRNALSKPDRLREVIAQLIAEGAIDGSALDRDDPLGFLPGGGESDALAAAAYRYCRWRAGVDVVLSGTSNRAHLEANVESIGMPPLGDDILARLEELFGQVDSISGS